MYGDYAKKSDKIKWWQIQDTRCEPDLYYQEKEVKTKWGWREPRMVKVATFSAAMISTFPGVFDDLEDNYEVESRLRHAGVIHKRNNTDTESCCLYVYFSNEKSAFNFALRLQAYIKAHDKTGKYCECGNRMKDAESEVCESCAWAKRVYKNEMKRVG
jgi:hypothetical protein